MTAWGVGIGAVLGALYGSLLLLPFSFDAGFLFGALSGGLLGLILGLAEGLAMASVLRKYLRDRADTGYRATMSAYAVYIAVLGAIVIVTLGWGVSPQLFKLENVGSLVCFGVVPLLLVIGMSWWAGRRVGDWVQQRIEAVEEASGEPLA